MKNLELKKKFRNKYVIRVAAGMVTVAVIGTSAGVSTYTVRAEKQETVHQSYPTDAWFSIQTLVIGVIS